MSLPAHDAADVPAGMWRGAALVGDADLGCVWLVEPDGFRSAALWPTTGYTATFEPLQVRAPDGRVVWTEGQVRDVGGGFSPVHVDRIPEHCRTGDRAWWIAPPL